MAVISIDSTNALLPPYPAQSLVPGDTRPVGSALFDALDASTAVEADTATSVDGTAARAALDQRIADDVAAGRLQQDLADRVQEALDRAEEDQRLDRLAENDRLDQAAEDDRIAAAQSDRTEETDALARQAAEDDPLDKTELSRTETVSGGVTTTVITYTDGTTETNTQFDALPDDPASTSQIADNARIDAAFRAGVLAATGVYGSNSANILEANVVQSYLATIQSGSLFNAFA